jgi:hypothetical protein
MAGTDDRVGLLARLGGAIAALVALVVLAVPMAALALPPNQADPGAWVPNAPVSDVVHHGNLTYIAGSFSWVGPWTGSLAAFGAQDGSVRSSFPTVRGGSIYAAVPDTLGGTYIAGDFSAVGGVQTGPVAHVLADGSVDTTFRPPVINDVVYALAVGTSGGNAALFAGGEFTRAGNQVRDNGAAFEISLSSTDNGKLLAWNPAPDGGSSFGAIHALATTFGSSTVFVGGDFDELGGSSRDGLGAVNATTGNLDASWTTQIESGSVVDALTLSSDNQTLYVGGDFTELGPSGSQVYRTGFGAVSTSNPGTPTAFAPQPNGQIRALSIDSSGDLFVGGIFTQIAGQPRQSLAEFSGDGLTSLDAQLTSKSEVIVDSLAVAGSPARLFVGGTFTGAGGQSRNNLAAVNPVTGAPVPFAPQLGGAVMALAAPDSSTLVAGGQFVSLGGVPRAGLAALDTFGHPTAFAPTATNSYVNRIAISPSGSTVYAISNSGFAGRTGAAAFASSTGALLPWDPQLDTAQINSIALDPRGTTVYIGGDFTSAAGTPRHDLVAVSAVTGAPTSWRPDPDQPVNAIAVSSDGSTVYAGGDFTTIGPSIRSRPHLAALSATTAEPTSWNPAPDGSVSDLALAPDGSGMYLAGNFTHIGSPSVARTSVAEVSLASGTATALTTPAFATPGYVYRVTPGGDPGTVFASGAFAFVGGVPRPGLAGFDATGALLSWSPPLLPGNASALATFDGDTAWLGGYFTDSANGHPYYLQFSSKPVATAPPSVVGSPRTGHGPVSCRPASWRNAPGSITTAWLLDGHPIAHAADATYTPTAKQSGHRLSCEQTASNAAGASTSTSAGVKIADGIAPTLKLKAGPKRTLAVTLSEAARLTIVVTGARHSKLGTLHFKLKAGKHTIRLPRKIGKHKLSAGKYLLRAFATDAAGNKSRRIAVHLTAR